MGFTNSTRWRVGGVARLRRSDPRRTNWLPSRDGRPALEFRPGWKRNSQANYKVPSTPAERRAIPPGVTYLNWSGGRGSPIFWFHKGGCWVIVDPCRVSACSSCARFPFARSRRASRLPIRISSTLPLDCAAWTAIAPPTPLPMPPFRLYGSACCATPRLLLRSPRSSNSPPSPKAAVRFRGSEFTVSHQRRSLNSSTRRTFVLVSIVPLVTAI